MTNITPIKITNLALTNKSEKTLEVFLSETMGYLLNPENIKIDTFTVEPVKNMGYRKNTLVDVECIFTPVDMETQELLGGQIIGKIPGKKKSDEYYQVVTKLKDIVTDRLKELRSSNDDFTAIKDLGQLKSVVYTALNGVTRGSNIKTLEQLMVYVVTQYYKKYQNVDVVVSHCNVSFVDKKSIENNARRN